MIDKIPEITIDKHIVQGCAYKQPLMFANLRFLASWLQYDDDDEDYDNDCKIILFPICSSALLW